MLIVNDAHLCLAGRSSLEERCHYCKKPLAAYPLVMSDDAKQTVYHVTCTLELATDLLVDLATFFHPPTPYQPLYVLTPPDAASAMMACGEQVPTEGDIHAGSLPSSDEDSHSRSGIHWASESVLRHRGRRCGQAAQGPTPGYDTRLGWTLVFGGQRVHCVRGPHASLVKEPG